jgi:hypothetical protein
VLHFDEQTWTEPEKQAYLQLLRLIQEQRINIGKIMLYTIARQSFQPEAAKLVKAEMAEMEALAADIKAMGFDVSVSG